MLYYIFILGLIFYFFFYYSFKIIQSRRQMKQGGFGEKITTYRKNYWNCGRLFVISPLVIGNAKLALDRAQYAKKALLTYSPGELTTDVVKSFQEDISIGSYIIPITVMFIITAIFQFIVSAKKGAIYENGITNGTTFYYFSEMEKIEEDYYIRLKLKKRKGLFKSIRLNPHEKEKDRIRDILCDKVAYEQIFY